MSKTVVKNLAITLNSTDVLPPDVMGTAIDMLSFVYNTLKEPRDKNLYKENITTNYPLELIHSKDSFTYAEKFPAEVSLKEIVNYLEKRIDIKTIRVNKGEKIIEYSNDIVQNGNETVLLPAIFNIANKLDDIGIIVINHKSAFDDDPAESGIFFPEVPKDIAEILDSAIKDKKATDYSMYSIDNIPEYP